MKLQPSGWKNTRFTTSQPAEANMENLQGPSITPAGTAMGKVECKEMQSSISLSSVTTECLMLRKQVHGHNPHSGETEPSADS